MKCRFCFALRYWKETNECNESLILFWVLKRKVKCAEGLVLLWRTEKKYEYELKFCFEVLKDHVCILVLKVWFCLGGRKRDMNIGWSFASRCWKEIWTKAGILLQNTERQGKYELKVWFCFGELKGKKKRGWSCALQRCWKEIIMWIWAVFCLEISINWRFGFALRDWKEIWM